MAAPMIGIVSGALLAAGHADDNPWILLNSRLNDILIAVISAAFLNGASNSLNQITDLEIDRKNKPDRPLPRGVIAVQSAALLSAFLYIAAILLAYTIRPEGSHATFYIVLSGALLTLIYSVPPFRTKRNGTLANLTIALARGLLLPVCGWSVVAGIDQPEPWIISSAYAIFIFGAATTKDFSDAEGDAEGNCQTWVVKFGSAKAAKLVRPFLVGPWVILAILWVLPIGQPILPGANTAIGLGLSTFLAGYGLWIGNLLQSDVIQKPSNDNYSSWKHIYLQYQIALLGVPWIYLL
jgi:4-hydroxybenzoate polyprenyltransferase